MVAAAMQAGRMLNMGRVTDMPHMLDELEDGHRMLIQEWDELLRLAKSLRHGSALSEETVSVLLKVLRQRSISFLNHAEEHAAIEERLLVPDLQEYYRPEDTMPSIRLSNLVMEEHYKSARQFVRRFIQQIDAARQPLSVSRARYLADQLREGLALMASYLKAEQQLVLPPAEQMTMDLESWYL